jgi:hypothetical protein
MSDWPDDLPPGTLLGGGDAGGTEFRGGATGCVFGGVAILAGAAAVRAVVAGFSTMRIGSRSPGSAAKVDRA